jgi:hypothetical protein
VDEEPVPVEHREVLLKPLQERRPHYIDHGHLDPMLSEKQRLAEKALDGGHRGVKRCVYVEPALCCHTGGDQPLQRLGDVAGHANIPAGLVPDHVQHIVESLTRHRLAVSEVEHEVPVAERASEGVAPAIEGPLWCAPRKLVQAL